MTEKLGKSGIETGSKKDLSRLVDYYRMKIESFERERIEFLKRLEGVKITQEEQHKQEWESRRRKEEIHELQNALAETNNALNSERKQVFHLTSELENAKLRTKEDRRRLVQLLELAKPIEQTVKLYYDRRPDKFEKYSTPLGEISTYDPDSIALSKSLRPNGRKSSATKSNQTKNISLTRQKSGNVNKAQRIIPSTEKQSIIKTIVFPEKQESNPKLEEENEFLRNKLKDMNEHFNSLLKKMEEDRRLRDEEMRLREIDSKDKIEELVRKNQKLEKINYELTKDYMQLKFDSSTNEKKLFEELETVKLQNEAISCSLNEIVSKSSKDKEVNRSEYERKTKEVTNVLRSQVKSHEENINVIKEQYKQIQKIYTTRVKELEGKLKDLTQKYNTIEGKKNFATEGYLNEIKLMRKRLKSYEQYVYKLRKMTATENPADNDFFSKLRQTKDDLDELEQNLNEGTDERESAYEGSNNYYEQEEGSQDYENYTQSEHEEEPHSENEKTNREIDLEDF